MGQYGETKNGSRIGLSGETKNGCHWRDQE